MGKPIKIRAKLKGDIAEVKALLPHNMESGMRACVVIPTRVSWLPRTTLPT